MGDGRPEDGLASASEVQALGVGSCVGLRARNAPPSFQLAEGRSFVSNLDTVSGDVGPVSLGLLNVLTGYLRAMVEDSDAAREELLREELANQDGKDPLRGSRTSGFWIATAGLGIVLVFLIVFIAQNTRKTTVSFLSWDGQVSVAVALLIAAVAGLFLALVAGQLRIMQLRRRVRRERRRS